MADEDVCHKAARNTHEADMGHLGVSPCSTRPSGNEEARNNAAQPIDGRLAGEFAEHAHRDSQSSTSCMERSTANHVAIPPSLCLYAVMMWK